LLNDKIQELQAYGFRYDSAVMVGGPSQSPIWPTIVADITGIAVKVGNQSAGAHGAALLAGQALGTSENE
jgi:sugar (pentulose or hexulose) kinase